MVDIIETLYTAAGTQGLLRILNDDPSLTFDLLIQRSVNLGSNMKLDLR